MLAFIETGMVSPSTTSAYDSALDIAGTGWILLLAFGIKAGFPLVHNWITDAYPESTPTGTVFLSAFTTKVAVYALARGLRREPTPLIWIGDGDDVLPDLLRGHRERPASGARPTP